MSKKKFDDEKNKQWDDILEDIDLQYLPIEYLKSVSISFDGGEVWVIDIAKHRKKQNIEDIEDALDDIFAHFDEEIESIDFKLDIEKIKKDLSIRVARFLKYNK